MTQYTQGPCPHIQAAENANRMIKTILACNYPDFGRIKALEAARDKALAKAGNNV